MAGVVRGEIRWAELDPTRGREQSGHRPVLVVSHRTFDEQSGTVIGMALTGQHPRSGFPLTVELRSGGLPRRCWVKIGQIRTLAIERLGTKIGRAAPDEVELVVSALNEIVGE